MQINNNELQIQQCLHGYADGHRMIAASIANFPPSAKRQLLEMSDISGPTMVQGFETYITGYPVLDLPYYAFAKTWYANEMERPGCVWTHTFLIPNKIVKENINIAFLLNAFIRPSFGQVTEYSQYETPKYIPIDKDTNWQINRIEKESSAWDIITPLLIDTLYDNSGDLPVFVPIKTPAEIESIVMRIWLTQHASLRENFSFCTGALSPRKINNRMLDLQFIPEKVFRTINREKAQIITFDPLQVSMDANVLPIWVNKFCADILKNNVKQVLLFVHNNDSDLGKDRKFLGKLLYFYYKPKQLLNKTDVYELLKDITHVFPNQNDAIAFKTNLIQSPFQFVDNDSENCLSLILTCLFTHDNTLSFMCLKEPLIELGRTFLSALKTERIVFIQQVATEPINELGVAFLEGIAQSATVDNLLLFAKHTKTLIGPFLEFNPKIATEPLLWNSFDDPPKNLIDHITASSNLTDTVMISIMDTLIALDHLAHIEYFTIRLRGKPLTYLLDLVQSDDQRIPKIYSLIIKMTNQYSATCMSWLALNNIPTLATLNLFIKTMDPLSPDVLLAGTEIWAQILNAVKKDLDNAKLVDFALFLLPLALKVNNNNSISLIRFAAPIVNDLLAKDKLDYTTWRRLDGILPRLPWYRSWDKCERLSLGLKERGL